MVYHIALHRTLRVRFHYEISPHKSLLILSWVWATIVKSTAIDIPRLWQILSANLPKEGKNKTNDFSVWIDDLFNSKERRSEKGLQKTLWVYVYTYEPTCQGVVRNFLPSDSKVVQYFQQKRETFLPPPFLPPTYYSILVRSDGNKLEESGLTRAKRPEIQNKKLQPS